MPTTGLATINVTMTPEQHEQWQKAMMQIYPIPGPEGQECSYEQWREYQIAEASLRALMPRTRQAAFLRDRSVGSFVRLQHWPFPAWVLEVRDSCAFEFEDSRRIEFAFRCDMALIGIYLRYSTPDARMQVYDRLLLSFIPRALRPLIEYAEKYKLRQGFQGCYQICQLCESDGLYRDPERWEAIEQNTRGGYKGGAGEWPNMAVGIFAIMAHKILCDPGELTSSENLTSSDRSWLGGLLGLLHSEYGPGRSDIPEDGIAQAFLAALESECPPPDWLPVLSYAP